MKICVFTDYRFAALPCPTGVTLHAQHMLQRLAAWPDVQVRALVPRDQYGRLGCLDFLPQSRYSLPWSLAMPWWTLFSFPAVDRKLAGVDWVYCPKNDWFPVRSCKLAVTFHGMSEIDPGFRRRLTPRTYLMRERRRIQYRKMVKHADVILVVSEFLRRQACEWFDADPQRVVVVGNGVDPLFFDIRLPSTEEPACSAETPYIVCVGGLNYMDGGDRVVALAQELGRRNEGVRIKLAGAINHNELARAAAATEMIDLLGYVRQPQLAALLSRACALYFPTRYETFGMAAAEAMACGCPVVSSRATAMPETLKDAGVFVDADDATDALHAVLRLRDDLAWRADRVSQGLRVASQYTWDNCAGRLVSALQRF